MWSLQNKCLPGFKIMRKRKNTVFSLRLGTPSGHTSQGQAAPRTVGGWISKGEQRLRPPVGLLGMASGGWALWVRSVGQGNRQGQQWKEPRPAVHVRPGGGENSASSPRPRRKGWALTSVSMGQGSRGPPKDGLTDRSPAAAPESRQRCSQEQQWPSHPLQLLSTDLHMQFLSSQ